MVWKSCFSFILMFLLTHLMPLVSFYTPRKHQKTFGFLMFSGGLEKDQWYEMGQAGSRLSLKVSLERSIIC